MKESDLCSLLKAVLLRSKRLESMKEITKPVLKDEYEFYATFIRDIKNLEKNYSINDIYKLRDIWISQNIDKCKKVLTKEMVEENKKLLTKYNWFIENLDKMSENEIKMEAKKRDLPVLLINSPVNKKSILSTPERFMETMITPRSLVYHGGAKRVKTVKSKKVPKLSEFKTRKNTGSKKRKPRAK